MQINYVRPPPGDQSAVDVAILKGSFGKAGVVLLYECRQECIAGSEGVDAG